MNLNINYFDMLHILWGFTLFNFQGGFFLFLIAFIPMILISIEIDELKETKQK